jgi:hypothetical protein
VVVCQSVLQLPSVAELGCNEELIFCPGKLLEPSTNSEDRERRGLKRESSAWIDACREENPSGWRPPFFQVTATEI